MSNQELELLEKWLADKSFVNWAKATNANDLSKWNKYLKEHPKHLELAEMGKFSILNLAPQVIPENKERSQAALERLNQSIASKQKKSQPKRQPKSKVISIFRTWSVAASLLLLVGLGTVGYFSFFQHEEMISVASSLEKREVLLSDGTAVTLNRNTILKYSEDNPRIVQLDGEAYFKVAKKPLTSERFQVKTSDLTVIVLGTEFNVNSRDDRTSVFLDEGKVKLNIGSEEEEIIEMQPGELVSYSKKQNKILAKKMTNSLENTVWKEDVVFFEGAPLQDVFNIINKVYDVSIEGNEALIGDKKFSGGLPVKDLFITLETLKEVYQFEIIEEKGKYIIK